MLLSLPDFDLLAADTVSAACSLLHRYGRDARIFAGGTDLLVKMKHRRMTPRHLIDIKGIRELDGIRHDAHDGLRIGALATIQSIKDSPVIAKEFPILNQAAGKMGTLHIRNLGTLGGNLANASPSAEFAPALLTLEASVKCVGRERERVVSLSDFFVGPGQSILDEDELLTEIHVPNLPPNSAGIYLKHSLRRMEVAIGSAAVVVCLDGDVCREARIALGAVGPTPFFARKAEAVIKGQKLGENSFQRQLCEEAAEVASRESLPIDDIRGKARFRRRVVAMLVGNALEEAIARARTYRPAKAAKSGERTR